MKKPTIFALITEAREKGLLKNIERVHYDDLDAIISIASAVGKDALVHKLRSLKEQCPDAIYCVLGERLTTNYEEALQWVLKG